ncbi:hypothetical protein [Rickettsiella endosymbiont of Rhagonycha lignosa]|uniref:hypothetical protein n=1 Tax=Rickettsiella endosymbiont of Rhagonycha lignosa TaxID=3077937 RepID=UPI00313B4A2C
MKKTIEAVDSKKQVIRSCLEEMNGFFSGETLTNSPCKSSLTSLPVSTQQAICFNPLAELLNEKNIFSLGENFFKKKAINELGCDLATQLIVNFIHFIQRKSCQLIDSKEIISVVPINQGLESVKKNNCRSSLNPEFINELRVCLPDDRRANLEKPENLAICIEKINNLPLGEKIKLCDNILRALSSDVSYLQVEPNNYFPLSTANSDEIFPQNNLYKILNLQRNYSLNIDSILFENLLHDRRIEKIACTSLQRDNDPYAEGKPLNVLLDETCFSKKRQEKNESLQIDLCEIYTKKIDKEDKSLLCNGISNFFKSNRFCKEGLQRLQLICNNLTESILNSSEVRQKIYEVKQNDIFEEIRNTNQRNGITSNNLQQVIEQNQSKSMGITNNTYNNSQLFAINPANSNTTLSNLTDSSYLSFQ